MLFGEDVVAGLHVDDRFYRAHGRARTSRQAAASSPEGGRMSFRKGLLAPLDGRFRFHVLRAVPPCAAACVASSRSSTSAKLSSRGAKHFGVDAGPI